MRKGLIGALAAAAALTVTAAPAVARQGCGAGFHRLHNGACVANRVGVFYHGYGWWDGHRYWHHRYRHHDVWLYR